MKRVLKKVALPPLVGINGPVYSLKSAASLHFTGPKGPSVCQKRGKITSGDKGLKILALSTIKTLFKSNLLVTIF